MKFQESVCNAKRYFQELDPKEQAIHVGVAVSGLLLVAGWAAGAKENYRGVNSTDCYGTVRTEAQAGQHLDTIATEIGTRDNVSTSDVAQILLHDNPNAVTYSVYTGELVIAEDSTSLITPERCD